MMEIISTASATIVAGWLVLFMGVNSVEMSLVEFPNESTDAMTPHPLTAVIMDLRITNRTYSDSLADQQSVEYTILRREVEELLNEIYDPTLLTYLGTNEMTFSFGSVVANSRLLFGTAMLNPVLVRSIFLSAYKQIPSATLEIDLGYFENELPVQEPLEEQEPTSRPPSTPQTEKPMAMPLTSTPDIITDAASLTSRHPITYTPNMNTSFLLSSSADVKNTTHSFLSSITPSPTSTRLNNTTMHPNTTHLPMSNTSFIFAAQNDTTASTPNESTSAAFKRSTNAAPNGTIIAAPYDITTASFNSTITAAPNDTTIAAPNYITTASFNSTTTAAPNGTTIAAPNDITTASFNSNTTAATNGITIAAPNDITTASFNSTTIGAPNDITTASFNSTTTAAPNGTTIAAPNDITTASFNSNTTAATNGITTASFNSTATAAPNGTTIAFHNSTTTADPNGTTTALGSTLPSIDSTTDMNSTVKTTPFTTTQPPNTITVSQSPTTATALMPGWVIALFVVAAVSLFLLIILLIVVVVLWCNKPKQRGFVNEPDESNPPMYFNPDIPMYSTHSTFHTANGKQADVREKPPKNRTGMYVVNK
ncbi:uncharacterized protein LOC127658280 [Xyrauchen texanus]|uniref:uncharacterized protein LOC127658280 n=1 Tax=Xyrauchen texanus TaxID=154827 RepID=UPI00224297DB|nr:uncharacterized protein LOC127658280 [Xyrauchen texanus]